MLSARRSTAAQQDGQSPAFGRTGRLRRSSPGTANVDGPPRLRRSRRQAPGPPVVITASSVEDRPSLPAIGLGISHESATSIQAPLTFPLSRVNTPPHLLLPELPGLASFSRSSVSPVSGSYHQPLIPAPRSLPEHGYTSYVSTRACHVSCFKVFRPSALLRPWRPSTAFSIARWLMIHSSLQILQSWSQHAVRNVRTGCHCDRWEYVAGKLICFSCTALPPSHLVVRAVPYRAPELSLIAKSNR